MTFKRETDRLPIPPRDAKVHNVVCHYCIVGCGYKAISWDVDRQGGPRPDQNLFGEDLTRQQGANTGAWYAPSMHNIVQRDGADVHLVMMPDPACVVNAGLGSARGARMAENSYSRVTGTQPNRLTTPLVHRYGAMSPTSWDDALQLVAEITRRVVEEMGEDGVIVSAFDHGGAGGGYENTWATGKLYFESMKVKNIRIHNRPAYNSEVHASRDMGVAELNHCYEDAELADTLVAVGTNALETQTNHFLNHWIPNLRGNTADAKRREFPDEPRSPARIVIIDPRRTVTVNACEIEAGRSNVLHLALNSGTDLILLNAIMTEIAAQGWLDRDFIAKHTSGFDDMLAAVRVTPEEAADVTGLSAGQIRTAAAWIAEPKGGSRRRTLFGYEKGLIWGNDNYRTNGALVNIALATGNIGRPGGGCVRMGGHQEGYVRPSDAHVGRPAADVDKLLIGGGGGIHHVWACDHHKTTLNASAFKRAYARRTALVRTAMDEIPHGDRAALADAIMTAIRAGGLFSVNVDILPSRIGQHAHVVLPAATAGEMNLMSMNGERRMRLTERYMDPPGSARPDCLIAAGLARALGRSWRDAGRPDIADRFTGYDWRTEEDAFMDGYHKHAAGGRHVTYERLRRMGTNGFQEPATDVDDDRIIGTKRLHADGTFSTPDGKAKFMPTAWRGLQAPDKQNEKDSFPYLINNGRTNQVWQSAYLDQGDGFVMDRFPLPFIEINPEDMRELGVQPGDIVEIHNDSGSTQAMAYPTPGARRKQTFMLFGHPAGAQGNVVSPGVNEFNVPNYKQTWANIRKIADAPEAARNSTFKSQEHPAG
jgi:arsenite oxidase large subunit